MKRNVRRPLSPIVMKAMASIRKTIAAFRISLACLGVSLEERQ